MLFDFPDTKEDNLLKVFEEIHDFIYANEGLTPQQTLEEFLKILFVKILCENAKDKLFYLSEEEWTYLNSKESDIVFVERFKELFEATKAEFSEIYEGDDAIRLAPLTLGFIVRKLQHISLSDSSKDAKGLAFQKFLSHHEKSGQGQFFTPEPVIDFCIKMISPKSYERIIDPACGSGGFLVSAINFIFNNENNIELSNIIENNIFGSDINKSIARIAKMKLLLMSNCKTNIICANSLEKEPTTVSNADDEKYDIVLANPPFGAKISNQSILKKYQLGFKWTSYKDGYAKTSSITQNQNAEFLFLERCLDLLKEGGRLAIVLPNGFFENPSMEYIRYYIKQNAKIISIVKLPADTFIPYGTGVKTSLLFLEKSSSLTVDYPIFFGKIHKTGYQGNKNATPIYKKSSIGNKVLDKAGATIIDEDFSEIVQAFQEFSLGKTFKNSNAFAINRTQLNGRLDYDFYSPENQIVMQNFISNNVKFLKDLCEIDKTKSKKLKDTSLSVQYVELSDINTHDYEIINSTLLNTSELPSRASFEIFEGDIITSVAGNSLGTRKHATALVSADYNNAICTNGFRVLRNFKIDPLFLLYYFKTDSFLRQVFMLRTGAAIPNISDIDFANIKVKIPDDNTLTEIVTKMRQFLEYRLKAKDELAKIDFGLVY